MVPIIFRVFECVYVAGIALFPIETAVDAVPDNRLRSAFLLRSAQVEPPACESASVDVLKAHFDAVIARLVFDTPKSIEIATTRLKFEKGSDFSWSVKQAWQHRFLILRNRIRNLTLLVEYRNVGQFPRNHYFAQPTPIFVDEHGAACAVGHLMIRSGRQPDVERTSQFHNNVFVPDIVSGPVYEWILTSGFTQVEAALIQPGYHCGPDPEVTFFEAAGEYSHTVGKLRFENFQMSFSGEADVVPDPERNGFATFVGPNELNNRGPPCLYQPELSHVIHFDGNLSIARNDRTHRQPFDLTISYNVVATDQHPLTAAQLLIGPSADNGPGLFYVNEAYGDSYVFQMTVSDAETSEVFGILEPDRSSGSRLVGDAVLQLPEPTAIRVETQFSTDRPFRISDFYHQFSIVGDDTDRSGDFDWDGVIGVKDIDALTEFLVAERSLGQRPGRLDVNGDGSLNFQDVAHWVKNLARTHFGDANVDGRFDSRDLVEVFTARKYDRFWVPASWSEGDWNADGYFDSADLVLALQDGGYQNNSKTSKSVFVPESNANCGLLISLVAICYSCNRKRWAVDPT